MNGFWLCVVMLAMSSWTAGYARAHGAWTWMAVFVAMTVYWGWRIREWSTE